MNTFRAVIACTCLMLAIVSLVHARDWHGIRPLRSTRSDVERLFGKAKVSDNLYDVGNERAYIIYSDGPCEEGIPGGYNVPADTVIRILASQRKEVRLDEVLIKGRNYKQSGPGHTGEMYHTDEAEGITYISFNGIVRTIDYGPTAQEEHLSCGDYTYAAPIKPGTVPGHAFPKFDEFSNIPFEKAKSRLDAFVIQLQNFWADNREAIGYIIVYGGRRSRINEAQVWADCMKNYLIKERGLKEEQIVAVDGGFREELTIELHIGLRHLHPPILFPTVSPRKIQIINKKAKICK